MLLVRSKSGATLRLGLAAQSATHTNVVGKPWGLVVWVVNVAGSRADGLQVVGALSRFSCAFSCERPAAHASSDLTGGRGTAGKLGFGWAAVHDGG
jgi:hypothetical protein